jgi:hypothetical protein
MKKVIVSIISLIAFAASLFSADGILVSQTSKTVAIEVAREWRTITFTLDPTTREVSVNAFYEEVAREDGVVKKRTGIREENLPWAAATNIAPALIDVRSQFNSALPAVLAGP